MRVRPQGAAPNQHLMLRPLCPASGVTPSSAAARVAADTRHVRGRTPTGLGGSVLPRLLAGGRERGRAAEVGAEGAGAAGGGASGGVPDWRDKAHGPMAFGSVAIR